MESSCIVNVDYQKGEHTQAIATSNFHHACSSELMRNLRKKNKIWEKATRHAREAKLNLNSIGSWCFHTPLASFLHLLLKNTKMEKFVIVVLDSVVGLGIAVYECAHDLILFSKEYLFIWFHLFLITSVFLLIVASMFGCSSMFPDSLIGTWSKMRACFENRFFLLILYSCFGSPHVTRFVVGHLISGKHFSSYSLTVDLFIRTLIQVFWPRVVLRIKRYKIKNQELFNFLSVFSRLSARLRGWKWWRRLSLIWFAFDA